MGNIAWKPLRAAEILMGFLDATIICSVNELVGGCVSMIEVVDVLKMKACC